MQEAEVSVLSRLSSEIRGPLNHEIGRQTDDSSPDEIMHTINGDEELHSNARLESNLMALRDQAGVGDQAVSPHRPGRLHRSPSGSSGDEVLGFTSKRSLILSSNKGSHGESNGLVQRKVHKVGTESLLKVDPAMDQAPVRKARVSVRTRLDSTSVSQRADS